MRKTSLCYIKRDNSYLMLHRVKKENDANHDKWIGIGGGFEPGESADDCVLREVKEETGLTLLSYSLRGIIDFISDQWEDEQMYLYTSDQWSGEMIECDEGNLEWVDCDLITSLSIWEGDKIFLDLLANGAPFFQLRLQYNGEQLVSAVLNETELKL